MQFHVLSFEGPDLYSRAGGLATRVEGLVGALAGLGFETHLWFVGDPGRTGHETRGSLHLHRWCQWISRHHPGGVYDGEFGKQSDYARSLPPYLLEHVLRPYLQQGGRAVVLAEEWHTADALLHLHHLLVQAGLRDRVALLWNANNTFGFERIDFPRLAESATVTTVSRYMKQSHARAGRRSGGDAQRAAGRGLRSAGSGARAPSSGGASAIARCSPRWRAAIRTSAGSRRSTRSR